MAMAGIREVLVYAENEKKIVTVTAGNVTVTGRVIRVNPLIVEHTESKGVTVISFESVEAVCMVEAAGQEVVDACKPQAETRFTKTSNF